MIDSYVPDRAPDPLRRHRLRPSGGRDGPSDAPTRRIESGSAHPVFGGRGASFRRAADALGPLAEYARDPSVTDLLVNGREGLWLDRGEAGMERVVGWHRDESTLRSLAVELVAAGGRHVDEASPCIDVRLDGGARVHVVLPPVSTIGTLISIRIPRAEGWTLDGLRVAGMVDDETASHLRAAVRSRRNILVSGPAGSGKTTLLSALLGLAAPGERIVTIEDVAELRIDHQHVLGLEARQANLEGAGAMDLARLLREALRMRPDRLVLGECRGSELRELLSALNTGHDGGAGTIHASSLDDVPARLEALGALAGMDPAVLARQVVSAIDLVLHLERRDGGRRLEEIGRFAVREDGRLAVLRGMEAPPERGCAR